MKFEIDAIERGLTPRMLEIHTADGLTAGEISTLYGVPEFAVVLLRHRWPINRKPPPDNAEALAA